jgi:hypothetical protein
MWDLERRVTWTTSSALAFHLPHCVNPMGLELREPDGLGLRQPDGSGTPALVYPTCRWLVPM